MTGHAWYVQRGSFRGVTWFASHWYGVLVRDDLSVHLPIEVPLDDEWARALSRTDGDYRWRAGMTCGRFLSREHLFDGACQVFAEVSAAGDVLYDGPGYDLEGAVRHVLATRTERVLTEA